MNPHDQLWREANSDPLEWHEVVMLIMCGAMIAYYFLDLLWRAF